MDSAGQPTSIIELPNQEIIINGDISKFIEYIVSQCKRSKSPRRRSKSPRRRSKSPHKRSKSPRKRSKSPTQKLLDIIKTNDTGIISNSTYIVGVNYIEIIEYIQSKYYKDFDMVLTLRWFMNKYRPLYVIKKPMRNIFGMILFNTNQHQLLTYFNSISSKENDAIAFITCAIQPCVRRRMDVLLESCFMYHEAYVKAHKNEPKFINYNTKSVFDDVINSRNFTSKIVVLFIRYESRFDITTLHSYQMDLLRSFDPTVV